MTTIPTARRRQSKAASTRKAVLDARTLLLAPRKPIPPRWRASLARFCLEALAHRFPVAMSRDHVRMLRRMQRAIKQGGQFAQAAPRGDGKTERSIAAIIWAILCGYRRYVVIVGSDREQAKRILAEVVQEVATNDMLADHFPDICLPIRVGADNVQAARYCIAGPADGSEQPAPVRMTTGANKLVLPTVPGYPRGLGGSVVEARGLTGSLRGMRHTTPDRKTLRPDLCVVDDPSTDESAKSPEQNDTREGLLSGAIMGMAGPRQRISAIVNCTVIARFDLADRLLDQRRHPEFHGVRFKFLYTPPTRGDLWKTYIAMRREGMRSGDNGRAAHDYYLANRAEMDHGARVGWAQRFREGEVSSLQCSYNIIADHGQATFESEYQNSPVEDRPGLWRLTQEQVSGNLSKVARGLVPRETTTITVGCDVNISRGLNWTCTAWTADGAGTIIDYGRYPHGDSPLWSEGSHYTEDQAIYLGIHAVLADVLHRTYARDDTGERVWVSGVGVDAGYKTDVVHGALKAARAQYGSCQIIPVRGVGAKGYWPRQSLRTGDQWHSAEWGVRKERTLFHNSDTWRERAQRGFLLPPGCPGGSISVYGQDPSVHGELARQLTSERIVDILSGERSATPVYVWFLEPGRYNDLLDALVYSLVVASYCGITWRVALPTAPTGTTSKPASGTPPPEQAPAPAKPKPVALPARSRLAMRPRQQAGGFVNGWR